MLNQLIDDFAQLITSGGDSRLLLGPTGLNRYGSGPNAGSKIQFGSCTSSSPSPRALDAAHRLYLELNQHPSPALLASEHFEVIRNQCRKFLALPADIDIALTPSGTDVEMLALALAASKTDQPIVNVVVGPSEVGSGTGDASAGRYFNSLTPCGKSASAQQPVDADFAARVSVTGVGVRNAFGQQRSMDEIDREVVQTVIDAVAKGAHVVVHLVAQSKTGIHAPSLNAIESIKSVLQQDVTIVVDAAQGRLTIEAYHTALRNDCLVSFTGSKFFGGPPFCGALLVPQSQRPGQHLAQLPNGFDQFFNRDTIPTAWESWRTACSDWTNTGLLLRWTAAIAEMEAFYETELDVREVVFFIFANEVTNTISASRSCSLLPTNASTENNLPNISSYCSVFAFEVSNLNQTPLSKAQLKELHQQLNIDPKFSFLIGQPVQLGQNRCILRVALGAPMIVDVATDTNFGETLDHRLSWLRENIRSCFKAIDSLVLTDGQFEDSTLVKVVER